MIVGSDAFLLGLIILALCLNIMAYAFRRIALTFTAAGCWLLLGLFAYQISDGPWDVPYGLFWFSIALVIISALEAVAVREKKQTAEPEEEESEEAIDRYLSKLEKQKAKQERWMQALESDTARTHRKKREGHAKQDTNLVD